MICLSLWKFKNYDHMEIFYDIETIVNLVDYKLTVYSTETDFIASLPVWENWEGSMPKNKSQDTT